jgi:hypothetical protein
MTTSITRSLSGSRNSPASHLRRNSALLMHSLRRTARSKGARPAARAGGSAPSFY